MLKLINYLTIIIVFFAIVTGFIAESEILPTRRRHLKKFWEYNQVDFSQKGWKFQKISYFLGCVAIGVGLISIIAPMIVKQ